ncbi:MAG: hypothetical protein DDG60_03600 [Anaerolineae bacterium]|nr:MAG: hypothetical protein DDG60_03600 [Anaerolineae bacterium]
MRDFLGSNIVNVKAHNMQAVLLSLLAADANQDQPLSRIQLAQKTNLSNTTITNLVAELIEQGMVSEDRPSRTADGEEQNRPVGRPRTGLRLVPNARYVVGIHIGVGLYRVALMNLRAEMLCSEMVNVDIQTSAEQVLERIGHSTLEMLAQCAVKRERVLGIGVGASGLVDVQNGVNLFAPNLNWHNIPIRDMLQSRVGLPVVVENNVRAMALGEAYFGQGREAQSLAFVYGRVGVGAGLVVGHELFRGSSTGAGEIGHMILAPEQGEACRCGNRGCLETLVAEPVLLHKAHQAAAANPAGLLADLLKQPDETPPIERLFQAARLGDADALHIVESAARWLGIALANLVNIFNPELIILGGMFAQGRDLILPVARHTLRQAAFARLGEKVRLETTRFGWRAGVTGAAALALLTFFYQQTSSIQATAAPAALYTQPSP